MIHPPKPQCSPSRALLAHTFFKENMAPNDNNTVAPWGLACIGEHRTWPKMEVSPFLPSLVQSLLPPGTVITAVGWMRNTRIGVTPLNQLHQWFHKTLNHIELLHRCDFSHTHTHKDHMNHAKQGEKGTVHKGGPSNKIIIKDNKVLLCSHSWISIYYVKHLKMSQVISTATEARWRTCIHPCLSVSVCCFWWTGWVRDQDELIKFWD